MASGFYVKLYDLIFSLFVVNVIQYDHPQIFGLYLNLNATVVMIVWWHVC